jgi:hypothetical protein
MQLFIRNKGSKDTLIALADVKFMQGKEQQI